MPVTIRYENDCRLVVWVFQGNWAWEDYYEHRDSVNDAIEAAGHPVDMIIDMSSASLLPKNLMTHAGNAARKAPANLRRTIFVGSNAVMRTFFNVFSQLYGALPSGKTLDFEMVGTLEEAYAKIRQSAAESQE